MNSKFKFRFSDATFDFGDGAKTNVQLVADEANHMNGLHITLLMGANGTSKSRLISSCVDLLCNIEESSKFDKENRNIKLRRNDRSSSAMHCLSASLVSRGYKFQIGDGTKPEPEACLPTRLLAIANLVRDRFTFADVEVENASRYYYLGVRQSSNLTTTGAMDQITVDAFLNIAGEKEKVKTFVNWVRQLLPECQLGIRFERFSSLKIQSFLENPNDWLNRDQNNIRSKQRFKYNRDRIVSVLPSVVRLLQFLRTHGELHKRTRGESSSLAQSLILQPEKMLPGTLAEFSDLFQSMSSALSVATDLGLIRRPNMMLNTGVWMDFASLSSGEQNLVATGARLISYATPGSFIVIDEPEVSLNVAWQQRYIELIQDALVHAHGSHVLIASHSPYLVSDLSTHEATIVIAERRGKKLSFKSQASRFWGWGSEAILYQVLGIPSASNYLFSRELASVLKLIASDTRDAEPFKQFLDKCSQLELPANAEPLRIVIQEIRQYYDSINS